MNPFKCKHVFFRTLFFNRISLIVMAKRIRKLKWNKANYKELVNFKMPVFSNNVKRQKKNELYPANILEREGSRVKIHRYVGYESSYDEWKDEAE